MASIDQRISTGRPGGESRTLQAGVLVFVVCCGLPAMEMNGFGFGLPITLPLALVIAAVGVAAGGALMCPRPVAAGLIGGLLAGPLGLVAVYYYTRHRVHVANLELVIVQGIACLPGWALGLWLKKVLTPRPLE